MKNLAILLISVFSVSVSAQDAIDKYFSYMDKDTSLTKVTVSGKMFELFQHMEVETAEEEEFKEAVSKLKSMRVVVKENAQNGSKMFSDANNKIGSEFETLMQVDKQGERFNFLIKEKDGIIAEFVMIGLAGQKEEAKFIVISITGDIDLAQISKISRTMNIKEMQHIEHIEDED